MTCCSFLGAGDVKSNFRIYKSKLGSTCLLFATTQLSYSSKKVRLFDVPDNLQKCFSSALSDVAWLSCCADPPLIGNLIEITFGSFVFAVADVLVVQI